MFSKTVTAAAAVALCSFDIVLACPSCSSSSVDPRGAYGEANGARALVNEAIESLGGRKALQSLHGITYESDEIFRISTLMQNYNLFHNDRYTVSSGTQNISYSFSGEMKQRIDRNSQPSDYFTFGTPSVPAVHFSLVTKSGHDGYACYKEGNDFVFVPPDTTTGYTDVHDHDLDIIVAFDKATKFPFIIRSFENHAIFGRTENDLRLFNYTEVNGMYFPTQRLVIYNDTSVLEQTAFSNIITNPSFPRGFFDGLEASKSPSPKVAPAKSLEYSHAEIGEYWTNFLWGGPYAGTYDNITTETLGPDLPNAHRLLVANNPIVEHLILDFEDGVIVFEAPPHQTDLVIRWVKENLKKPITHIFPTHHHHDHNYDIHKYVALGAKIIAPEVGAAYWKQIPGAEVLTFTENEPYIHSDSQMQARFIWHKEAPHSVDWSYAIVTTRCPTANSTMLAYEADAFSTLTHFATQLAYGWLDLAVADGMSYNTTVVPTHGMPVPLTFLLDQIGYVYPAFDSTDLRAGGASCLA
ncbi:hypothetical protein B0T10DRAFT_577522 [Thelonectria olida]|uniref:Metallo-beta-lactamase domain-containing protein n=1 Tax=Thelonectria olida TaxID=1576542 RepID=A0A9P9AVW0_9HYPO|nr:hypothetical protein B0T10DRAFT_577522 [Thelonectria olida]